MVKTKMVRIYSEDEEGNKNLLRTVNVISEFEPDKAWMKHLEPLATEFEV